MIQSDKVKAILTVSQLTNLLFQLKADVVDSRNISDRCIDRKEPHLNFLEQFN